MKTLFMAARSALLFILAGFLSAADKPATEVVYKNAQYGITFTLPQSWHGYSVVAEKWEGSSQFGKDGKSRTKEQGARITLRHPKWSKDAPTQDIPLYVFTRTQWKNGAWPDSREAGGVMYEVGHNDQYVYAICSRYNFADDAKEWKSASDAVESNIAANKKPLPEN